MTRAAHDRVAAVKALLVHDDPAAVEQGIALAEHLPAGARRALLGGAFLADGRREVDHRTPPAGTLVLGDLKGRHAAYVTLTLLLREPRARPLRELYVRDRTLTSLPEALFARTELVDLEISDCALTELSPRIGELVNLERLACGQPTLTSLPDAIDALTRLYWLDLHGFGGDELPDAIGRLAALEGLDVGGTTLSRLPDLSGCPRLHWLLTDSEQCLFLRPGSHARRAPLWKQSRPVNVMPGHSRQR
jgi:Leucine-rich repeat (LRR) protein